MKVTIDIDEVVLDKLVKQELLDSIESLTRELKMAKSGEGYIHWRHQDSKKDIKHMKKMIKAYKQVLEDYKWVEI